MNRSRQEADRWFRQAREDLTTTRCLFEAERFDAACFYAHQAAEKAAKALRYHAGERVVIGHGVADLLAASNFPVDEVDRFARLDEYYIPARYPNGLPGDRIPARHYTRKQAEEALGLAEEVLHEVGARLFGGEAPSSCGN